MSPIYLGPHYPLFGDHYLDNGWRYRLGAIIAINAKNIVYHTS